MSAPAAELTLQDPPKEVVVPTKDVEILKKAMGLHGACFSVPI